MYQDSNTQQTNTRVADVRKVYKLDSSVAPLLPVIEYGEITACPMDTGNGESVTVFNCAGWDPSQNVIGDLQFTPISSGPNANTFSVVSDTSSSPIRFGSNNRVLEAVLNANGSGFDFGGGLSFKFRVPEMYNNNKGYVWAYAVVRKVPQATNFQVAMGVNNYSNNLTGFSGVSNGDWHLLMAPASVGSAISSGLIDVRLRCLGVAGGSPVAGATINIQSVGVGIGGPPIHLAAAPNIALINLATYRRSFQSAWTAAILSNLASTGSCNASGATLTFSSINVNGTARFPVTDAVQQVIATPGTGAFPSVVVNCDNTISVSWGTSVPSFGKRIYAGSGVTTVIP
jgi:hypothetical protein